MLFRINTFSGETEITQQHRFYVHHAEENLTDQGLFWQITTCYLIF
jgi:hypothetical protein